MKTSPGYVTRICEIWKNFLVNDHTDLATMEEILMETNVPRIHKGPLGGGMSNDMKPDRQKLSPSWNMFSLLRRLFLQLFGIQNKDLPISAIRPYLIERKDIIGRLEGEGFATNDEVNVGQTGQAIAVDEEFSLLWRKKKYWCG